MINEADRFASAVDGNTSRNIGTSIPGVHILQGITVHDGKILHGQAFYGINIFHDLVMSLLDRMLFPKINTGFQKFINLWSNFALVSCK